MTQANSKYAAPDATIDDLRAMHRSLGIARGHLVQATAYGTDPTVLLEALAAHPEYVGIALVDETTTDADLARLHDGGVRGARFNFSKFLGMAPTREVFARAMRQIGELGWIAKVHAVGDEWLEYEDLFRTVTIPVVIDHMGHLDIQRGVDQAPLRCILNLLERDNWWVMLSNADRYSVEGPPWNDTRLFARTFLEAIPDRCVWGTDWPHVLYTGAVPADADLLELLDRFADNDRALTENVLACNPRRLFAGTLAAPSL